MSLKKSFIEKSIEIASSAANVWKILTSPDYSREWIRTWWPEFDVLESPWQPGAYVRWRLCNGAVGAEGVVILADPYGELAYTFETNDANNPQKELLKFRLREIDKLTFLGMTVGQFGAGNTYADICPGAADSCHKSLQKIKQMAESTQLVAG